MKGVKGVEDAERIVSVMREEDEGEYIRVGGKLAMVLAPL
jgi:hypothetical protein